MKETTFYNFLTHLPKPAKLTYEDCQLFWKQFRDLLKKLIETNTFDEIISLLFYT